LKIALLHGKAKTRWDISCARFVPWWKFSNHWPFVVPLIRHVTRTSRDRDTKAW